MVKSELVLKLIESYRDDELFNKVAWQIVEDEKSKGNQILTNRFKNLIRKKSNLSFATTSSISSGFPQFQTKEEHNDLFELIKPTETIKDIVLSRELENSLKMIVKEIKNKEKLYDWGIKEFGRILLYGLPGTGKTLWAYVLTNELKYELLYVRLDALISSYLGETGKNIRKIFDLANNSNLVLFIDEFDAIAKMRDDSRELGELKRVVNVLIQNIDNFNSNSILVAATNHPQLLDVAIWRRFDEVLEFDLPNKLAREKIFQIHTRQVPLKNLNIKQIIGKTSNFSGDDIRKMVRHAVRHAIQNNRDFVNFEDFDKAIQTLYTRKTREMSDHGASNKIALAKSYRAKGYSLKEIAKEIKVSPSTAWRYVNKS